MKLELKENQGVPSSLLWTLAIISGVTVANIYYNQPLLNRISRDLNISEFTANLIGLVTDSLGLGRHRQGGCQRDRPHTGLQYRRFQRIRYRLLVLLPQRGWQLFAPEELDFFL